MVFIWTVAVTFFMTLGIAAEVDREETPEEFEKRIIEEAIEHNEREFERLEEALND